MVFVSFGRYFLISRTICFQIHIQKGKTPPNIFAKIDTNQDKKISKEEMAEFILETGTICGNATLYPATLYPVFLHYNLGNLPVTFTSVLYESKIFISKPHTSFN